MGVKLSALGAKKRTENAFAQKGLLTAEDLARFAPREYRDYTSVCRIQAADPERYAAFSGQMVFFDKRLGKTWYLVMRLVQDDGVSIMILLFGDCAHESYYRSLMHRDVVVLGKPSCDSRYGYSVRYPYGIVEAARFVPHVEPVYPKIKGVSDETFQSLLRQAVALQEDPLEKEVLEKYSLPPYPAALRMLHSPESGRQVREAKRRMLFDDMLYFATALEMYKEKGTEETSVLFPSHSKMREFTDGLPYTLTKDQVSILDEFCASVESGRRFHVLVQGDVGCGKTVVAAAMIVCACENGYQAVLTAPREVLARQHYMEMEQYASKLGYTCAFLHSGMTPKEKKAALDGIRGGGVQIVVGTHSCLSEGTVYARLGLTVTDEEHLFGVRQKEALAKKAEEGVHAVSMSATPIPRSLAFVLYGQGCRILSIHTMPPGRKPVKTAAQRTHKNTFPFMEKQIREGHQCYAVCPAIEENEEYGITAIETVEGEYRNYFEPKGFRIGIVNGRMDAREAAEAIAAFVRNETQILISTTVIEVGVNVPNATVMVVEQADRFGLASLHQLRGRVGRSSAQSYCILMSRQENNPRIETMVRTTDGFEIAEADLAQRGSGDLLGVRQAGHNRFVEEMLRYPLFFRKAVEAAKYCAENGFGTRLAEHFGDHAEQAGEDI